MTELGRALLDIERQLWRNDVDLYGDNLLPEAMLVFPETGVVDRAFALDAIRAENREGRRWAEVEFENIRALQLVADVAALTYKVTARWEHESQSIQALASSVYVKRDGTWKLALHQQSAV